MTSAGSVVLPLLESVAALIALKLGASAAPARVCGDIAQGSRLSASHATAHNTSSSADEAFSGKTEFRRPSRLARMTPARSAEREFGDF
jgi:hypothetical protein